MHTITAASELGEGQRALEVCRRAHCDFAECVDGVGEMELEQRNVLFAELFEWEMELKWENAINKIKSNIDNQRVIYQTLIFED